MVEMKHYSTCMIVFYDFHVLRVQWLSIIEYGEYLKIYSDENYSFEKINFFSHNFVLDEDSTR